MRRFDDALVDMRERDVERQHHVRQEVVDHADDDGQRRVDERDLRQRECMQHHVDDAVLLEDGLPGHRRPERQQEQEEDQDHAAALDLLQDHAERIGEHEADDGADECELHREAERPEILHLHGLPEVREREGPFPIRQAVIEDEEERQHDEKDGPDRERRCKQPRNAFAVMHHAPPPHLPKQAWP